MTMSGPMAAFFLWAEQWNWKLLLECKRMERLSRHWVYIDEKQDMWHQSPAWAKYGREDKSDILVTGMPDGKGSQLQLNHSVEPLTLTSVWKCHDLTEYLVAAKGRNGGREAEKTKWLDSQSSGTAFPIAHIKTKSVAYTYLDVLFLAALTVQ